jgi:hypothetical protein
MATRLLEQPGSRRAADVFLAQQGDALGHRSSRDLDVLLGEV